MEACAAITGGKTLRLASGLTYTKSVGHQRRSVREGSSDLKAMALKHLLEEEEKNVE